MPTTNFNQKRHFRIDVLVTVKVTHHENNDCITNQQDSTGERAYKGSDVCIELALGVQKSRGLRIDQFVSSPRLYLTL